MSILRFFLFLLWIGSLVAATWGAITANSSSRERRGVRTLLVHVEATGQAREELQLREEELGRSMLLGRAVAAAGAGVFVLIPAVRIARRLKRIRRRRGT